MKNLLALVVLLTSCLASAPSFSQDSPLLTSQWVQLDSGGGVSGRVVIPGRNGSVAAVSWANVTMHSGSGRRLDTVANRRGEFRITGARAGVYTLTAFSDNAVACYALHVVPAAGGYPVAIEIAAAGMRPDLAIETIDRYRRPFQHSVQTVSQQELETDLLPLTVSGKSYRVLRSEGGLSVHLYAAGVTGGALTNAQPTNVFVMRSGLQVGRAVTAADGSFRISGLSEGDYELVSVGPSGVAVVGFELVNGGLSADLKSQTSHLVAQGDLTPAHATLRIQLAPIDRIPIEIIVDQQDEELLPGDVVPGDVFGTPIAGGGFAPGYSGGGGGFSGGGGGGGFGGSDLIGLAAIGGVIAAVAASDDDAVVVNPPPASPAIP